VVEVVVDVVVVVEVVVVDVVGAGGASIMLAARILVGLIFISQSNVNPATLNWNPEYSIFFGLLG